MSPGLQAIAVFGGSLPGSILMSLGQALVVVCVCFDMVRAVSVPRSRRRYLAFTVFTTLAWPAIVISAAVVLIYAAGGAWLNAAGSVFVMVAVIFRWHHGSDEDSWWTGKGKALGRWLRRQAAALSAAAPATA
jgi:predicted membrane channel-forming protein YqfA (hemolysin III family)